MTDRPAKRRPDSYAKATAILEDILEEDHGKADRMDVEMLLQFAGFTFTQQPGSAIRIYGHPTGVRFTVHTDHQEIPIRAVKWVAHAIRDRGLI